MRVVSFYNKVLADKIIDTFYVSLPAKLWEWTRLAFELLLKRVNMVAVDVRVAELNDELVCLRASDMCDHMGE